MSSNKYNETWFINNFKNEIAIKYFCHSETKFRHSDFIRLSEEIFNVSKVQLSINTLKRFFNENNRKTPHLSTLDAMAQYLEYENWNDYKQRHLKHENIIGSVVNRPRFSKKKISVIISVFVGIALFYWFYSYYQEYRNNKNIANINFYYTIENERDPPYFKFHYNLKNIEFKNAQLWPLGRNTDVVNLKNEDTVTLYGYGWYDTFHPKLVVDDNVVKELSIDVQSDGWKAAVCKFKSDEFFQEYLHDDNIFSNGELGITDEVLYSHNFTNDDLDICYYVNARDFNQINGDALCFDTKIKNKQISKNTKSGIHTIILAFEKGMIYLPITENEKFNLNIPLGLFDIWNTPDKKDLTMLSIEQMVWNTLNIITINKKVIITINEKNVYESNFTTNPGILKRIEFQFRGLGLVDYVRFFNPDGEIVYHDEFD